MASKDVRWSIAGGLRVLFKTRPDLFNNTGGDTVVVNELAENLRRAGATVTIDSTDVHKPQGYDLIHLFNFATPEHTESLARQAVAANVPYVVTTMYEDRPRFFNQMFAYFLALQAYIGNGQQRTQWEELVRAASQAAPSPRWENKWTANNAAALIATGYEEARTLREDYPNARLIRTYNCGSNIGEADFNPRPFTEAYGIKDFVLCVGRLETRKNQLMLLKALEDSDFTVVLATSGFTYQPEYEQLCRAIRRKGKTIFLPRLEPQMLASAYAAARVHALPSWYELPGLVSIEAARAGASVVVSEYGTIRDYLGNDAFYCEPGNANSIASAVQRAFEQHHERIATRESVRTRLSHYTWENSAFQTLRVYADVLNNRNSTAAYNQDRRFVTRQESLPIRQVVANVSSEAAKAEQSVAAIGQAFVQSAKGREGQDISNLCDQGDNSLRAGMIEAALASYQAARAKDADAVRPRRSLGVAYVMANDLKKAKAEFRAALEIEPGEAKSLAGLANVLWQEGEKEEAFRYCIRACESDPGDIGLLMHLMNISYAIGRHEDLERMLRHQVRHNPENLELQYCLAGCYYRQQKISHAMGLIERILLVDPNHARTLELKEQILLSNQTPQVDASAQPTEAEETPVEAALRSLERAKELKDYPRVIEGALLIEVDSLASEDEKDLALVLHGEALACMGQLGEAEECFEKVPAKSSLAFRVATGLGVLRATAGNWAEAEKLFIHACALNPNYDVALAGLGLCASQYGDSEKSWGYYRRALSCNPENIRALYGLIDLGYQTRRLHEVEKALKAYLCYHPLDLSILYSLAGCLYAQDNLGESKTVLEKILFVNPEYQLARELQGRIETNAQQEELRA